MKLKRAYVITLLGIAALVAVTGILYYRATIPFHTATQFLQYVYAHQLDDAKRMIDPEDLNKLPPEYWSRIEHTEFRDDLGWSFSYTRYSLLRSTIAFWVNVPDGNDWTKDASVQYYATGRKIKVQETDFSLAPR